MLDLVGYPPTLDEVKAFMADTNIAKRSERIESCWSRTIGPTGRAAVLRRLVGNYHDVPIMLTPNSRKAPGRASRATSSTG